MDIHPETENRIKDLASELQQLFQNYILKNPSLVEDKMERAGEIIKEIKSMGFMVQRKVGINPNELESADATVTILKPKDNLSPEDQKIYDDWFLGVVGVKT